MECQDRIAEGVQGGWEGAEAGKGQPGRGGLACTWTTRAGRLISAKGGIRSEDKSGQLLRRGPPQAVNWKTQNTVLVTATARVGIALGSEGREKTNRKRSCSQNSKPQQLTVELEVRSRCAQGGEKSKFEF